MTGPRDPADPARRTEDREASAPADRPGATEAADAVDEARTTTAPVGEPAPTADHAPPRRGAAAGGLGRQASVAGMLMVAQTVASQIIGIGGFVLLGWLLDEEAHGLFVQTITVAMLGALVQQIGIRATLLSRAARYGALAGSATVLMAAGGVGASALLMLAAPAIAALYDSPDLVPLIRIIALGTPFAALSVVAEARLQIDMRFRAIALVQFLRLAGEMVLMVVLAVLEFGPYALVVPRAVATISAAIATWALARPRLVFGRDRRGRRLRRSMGRFLRDARHLTPANAANYLIGQGDRILLSAFQPSAAVGLYGFAMGISTRPALVLDRSLAIVLMPVLGKLSGQPRRQAAAFVRVTRLLAAITAPICAGIAVAADPLMHAVMHPRWIPTIPILQWLAVATGAGIVTRRYAAMLDIQRRFATRLRLNLLHAGVLVVALVPAAGAGPVSVAATLAFVNLAVGLLKIRIALAGAAEPWRATLSIPAPALAAALPAAGLAWLAAAAVPDEPAGRWIQLLVIPVVLLPAHAILLRLVSRDVFDEARGQVDLVTERLRRRRR